MLLTMITGAVAGAIVNAFGTTSSSQQRVSGSNDAQLIAGFFTRDGQSAGGTDPATGLPDPALGVSTTDDGGCTAPGALLVRMRWVDLTAGTSTRRAVVYWYDAPSGQVVRTLCDGSSVSSSVLAKHVIATTAPKSPLAWCDDDETAPCSASSRTVSIRVTESNQPQNAAVPYSYTLTASLRTEAGAPTGGPRAPLILFGGPDCPAGNATGLSLSTALLRVRGQAFIDSGADDPSCPAMRVGTLSGYTATRTSVLDPGVCRSSGLLAGPCPAVTAYDTPIPDPFANLAPPVGGTAQSGCPGGHASPGVYDNTLAIGVGSCVLDSGVYMLRDGISITTGSLSSGPGGVLIYITGGTFSTALGALVNLAPMTSGPYAGLLLWQDKADTTTLRMGNLALFVLDGTVYAPTATLDFSNVSVDFKVGGVVAQSLVLDTVGAMDVGP